MRTEFSRDGTAVKIYGDYSPCPIIVKTELLEQFGGDYEALFHRYHKLFSQNALPYAGRESHPVSLFAWQKALDNEERGEKYWKWGQKCKGRWQYTGIYYEDDNAFYFVDSQNKIWETVTK